MAKEKILDIGIGKGGDYMYRAKAIRIGLDIDVYALLLFQNNQSTALCQGDAEVSEHKSLPFKSESFSHVDIILPHDYLLFALTQSDANLWNELHRVTNRKANVTVIVDVPLMGQQGIHVHKRPIIISMPQIRIVDSAIQASFKLSNMKQMTVIDMQKLGTEFSALLAQDMETVGTHVYKITVNK